MFLATNDHFKKKNSDFEVLSSHLCIVRLIEWLEILKILGADKIYFYKLRAHENMEKVLDFYTKQL
jgi:hypothetical protein